MIRITRKFFDIFDKRQKVQALGLIALMVLGGFVESLSVSLVFPLIEAVINGESWKSKWYTKMICDMFGIQEQRIFIMTILIVLVFVFLFKNILVYFQYYIQYNYVARGRYNMQTLLMKKFMHKPYEFFLDCNTAEVMRIVLTDSGQAFNLLMSTLMFYTEAIVAVILSITTFLISHQIAILILISLSVEILVISKMIKPKMFYHGQVFRRESSATNKWFLQSVDGIKSIKVEGKEDFFVDNYANHNWKLINADRKQQTIGILPRVMIEAFTVSIVLMYAFLYVKLGNNLADLVPQLSAFVLAALRLLPSANRMSGALNIIPFQEGGLDNVIATLKANSDALSINSNNEMQKDNHFKRSISVENVSFSYKGSEKVILNNVSIEIRKGESVGLVGSSGAGKTTLVDIILRLLRVEEGRILYDDTDVTSGLNGWQNQIAYIPQQIFLMDDTIKNNIIFGECIPEGECNDRVIKALKEASLFDFVNSLPNGIDTEIGEKGVRLSGGQRQRIGIARALFKNPEILFLDEATSALDKDTEQSIMESIEELKGKKTLIIIAHRLSTIEKCDSVYRIKNGKIIKER